MSARTSSKAEIIVLILSVGMLTMVAASLAAMLFLPVPEQNREAVSLLIGAIISQSGSVVAYFFGRSDGDTKKDQTIGIMADTMRAQNPDSGAVTITPPITEPVTISPARADE